MEAFCNIKGLNKKSPGCFVSNGHQSHSDWEMAFPLDFNMILILWFKKQSEPVIEQVAKIRLMIVDLCGS